MAARCPSAPFSGSITGQSSRVNLKVWRWRLLGRALSREATRMPLGWRAGRVREWQVGARWEIQSVGGLGCARVAERLRASGYGPLAW